MFDFLLPGRGRRSSNSSRHEQAKDMSSPTGDKKPVKSVQKSQQTKHGYHFIEFQRLLLNHILNRKRGQEFGGTFIEYVLVEVAHQNEVLERPPSVLLEGPLQSKSRLKFEWREECQRRYGVSPYYHGKIYMDLVNAALEEEWTARSSPAFENTIPGKRRGHAPSSDTLMLQAWKANNRNRVVAAYNHKFRLFPPPSDTDGKKALEFFQECQERENKRYFINFEKQLLHHIRNREQNQEFGSSFIEYVMLEVAFRTMKRDDPWAGIQKGAPQWNWSYAGYWRRECKRRYGVSPYYHGKIYINLVNAMLMERRIGYAVFDYMLPIPRYDGRSSQHVPPLMIEASQLNKRQ